MNDDGSVYDWWSGHQRLFRALSWLVFGGREAELRSLARARLLAGPGDRVLEVGCGPGRSFKPLAVDVGPDGRVVGVDHSAGMVRRAGARARTLTVDCEAVRADAATLPFPDGSFDRAYSTLALSAVADAAAAVAEVERVLGPDGRFVVFDTRPFQSGPGTLLNPVTNRVSSWATDWHPDADVLGALESSFDAVDTEVFLGGTTFVSVAETSD
ncbi:methyltransferase domain-containing protein [Salinirubellus salinus]|uniref:Methyltransferase domain-containing protein n=1 Tax=Salinirubellus salinus TaxID=1364945 RepID=A0A9E7R6L4_9EURY|nr:methyltransferase domain-containing protein [Salinirubellus salinus]UWM56154.1 methyltransferase domain-containing protein [Salinirubellus salinus]